MGLGCPVHRTTPLFEKISRVREGVGGAPPLVSGKVGESAAGGKRLIKSDSERAAKSLKNEMNMLNTLHLQ